ncbi:MAG: phosphoserine phosphatase SerB [Alphaproteobacteria bacterium]|nr:phosphoserine phosphatase SerB [Alphaproteobacteria bacterium]
MSTVLTLVASDPRRPLCDGHTREVIKILGAYNVQPTCQPIWIKPKKVAEIGVSDNTSSALFMHLRDFLEKDAIDVFITPIENRRKKLVLADMDSTIVRGETLDDLAEHAGIKDQIAEITARAMNGELDFHAALNERVGLLKGLETTALDKTLSAMTINPGAQTLIQTMRKNGAHCVLVSGGFTFFTGAVAKQVGFHSHHGNVLEIEDGALTGKVKPPILDKHAKVECLRTYMDRFNLKPKDCLTIGDGANDIPMLKTAGLGIGYKPKPAVANQIDNLIIHGDLSAALYAQGFTDSDFYLT